MQPTTNVAPPAVGPGALLWAPLGSTEPTNTVVGSVFTDLWDSAWMLWGFTDAGHTFTVDITTSNVEAAELIDPWKVLVTGRSAKVAFALGAPTASQIKRLMNGGTLTTTGTTTTTKTEYEPPAPGAEVRCMLGWQSVDNDERTIWRQCLNTGSVAMARQKAPNNTKPSAEFTLEAPTSGAAPWKYSTAGVARA